MRVGRQVGTDWMWPGARSLEEMGRDLSWVCLELDLWISREAPTCRDSSDGDQAGACCRGTSLASFGLGWDGLAWAGLGPGVVVGSRCVALRCVALVLRPADREEARREGGKDG